jgi:hypothetical protein
VIDAADWIGGEGWDATDSCDREGCEGRGVRDDRERAGGREVKVSG